MLQATPWQQRDQSTSVPFSKENKELLCSVNNAKKQENIVGLANLSTKELLLWTARWCFQK